MFNKYFTGSLILLCTLMAIRITWVQHGWVNNDSLLYFECSRLITQGDWSAAFKLYSWLLYPALLALGHAISGLSIHLTAQVLNVILFSLFSWGFIQLVRQAGGKRSTQVWAVVLLLSTQYMVGDVLGMLLRDEGFWAGFIWGLLSLLRYMQTGEKRQAYYFQIAMIVATLFRMEAIAYLLLLPLLILWQSAIPLHQRFKKIAHCLSIPLLAGTLFALATALDVIKIQQLGRLQEIIYMLQQGWLEKIHYIREKSLIISEQVIGRYFEKYALMTLWTALTLIVLDTTLFVAGWPVLMGLILGRKGWRKIDSLARQLFSLQLIIGLIISIVMIFNLFVLSGRYVIASGIVMLVIGAFCVEQLYITAGSKSKKAILLLIALLVFLNLHDSHRIDLNRLAVQYIASINSKDEPVLYDTENARFYAHQPFLNRVPSQQYLESLLNSGEIHRYAIIMISIGSHDQAYEQSIRTKLNQDYVQINTIYGWRKKNKVLIFKRRAE